MWIACIVLSVFLPTHSTSTDVMSEKIDVTWMHTYNIYSLYIIKAIVTYTSARVSIPWYVRRPRLIIIIDPNGRYPVKKTKKVSSITRRRRLMRAIFFCNCVRSACALVSFIISAYYYYMVVVIELRNRRRHHVSGKTVRSFAHRESVLLRAFHHHDKCITIVRQS